MENNKIVFIEKNDEFKGTKLISTSWVYIGRNSRGDVYDIFEVANTYDDIFHWAAFDTICLKYIELENGMGEVLLEVLSSAKFKTLGNPKVLPKWNDEFPMIIDGERCILKQFSNKEKGNNYEELIFSLPIDVLSKMGTASEIKISLRGKNHKLEGALLQQHIKYFKAFELFCFADKMEAENIFAELNQEIQERIEKEEKEKVEKKEAEKEQQAQVIKTQKKSKSKKWLIYIIIIIMGGAIAEKFSDKKDTTNVVTSSLAEVVNDQPGSYLISEEMTEGAPIFNMDKKTKRNKKLPVFTKLYIKKVEDSLGFFEDFYDEQTNKVSKGWIKMNTLVEENNYFTYSYGEKYWVKSNISEAPTYTDYKKSKQNKRKLKPMEEITVFYIKDNVAYFNNGILDNYRKGWVELDKIEKQ